MAEDENRLVYGHGCLSSKKCGYLGEICASSECSICGGYNPYQGYGYGLGFACSYFPGYVAGVCIEQYFIQNLCYLRGEHVKVLLEHSHVICGRLVQVELNYISVSVEGSVAYIPLNQVVAIIPI